MSTILQTPGYHEIVTHLPTNTVVIFHDVGWDEYEHLLDQVGESRGLRISYIDGTLQVMSPSAKHESYVRFLEKLSAVISLRLRINILSFGSSTMKKQKARQGLEPDACFYVQTAALIGNRMQFDFATDPPPDIAVEIDIHHGSIYKFPIYAALGVPEIWQFDGQQPTIHQLAQDTYIVTETSRALPLLTNHVLTEFLTGLRDEGEFQTILAFDRWLQTETGAGGQGMGPAKAHLSPRLQRSTATCLTDQTFGSLWCSADPWPPAPVPCSLLYSYLKATIGSTFVARLAGT